MSGALILFRLRVPALAMTRWSTPTLRVHKEKDMTAFRGQGAADAALAAGAFADEIKRLTDLRAEVDLKTQIVKTLDKAERIKTDAEEYSTRLRTEAVGVLAAAKSAAVQADKDAKAAAADVDHA